MILLLFSENGFILLTVACYTGKFRITAHNLRSVTFRYPKRIFVRAFVGKEEAMNPSWLEIPLRD